jgi:hypothetical protein
MKSFIYKTLHSAACASLAVIGMNLPTMATAQGTPQGGITFTFTSTSENPAMLGGNGKNGVPYSGWHWIGSSIAQTSTGQKIKSSFTCVMMTQPPTDTLFMSHMLCDVTSAEGTYSATMGCQFIDQANLVASCIGGLYGTGGTYAGKRGSITNYARGGTSIGTGQWF